MSLQSRIEEVFTDVPIIGPLTHQNSPDADMVEAVLSGTRASELTPDQVRKVRWDLGQLRPEAYHALLPGLMRLVVDETTFVDGLGEAIITSLTPPDMQELSPAFQARMAMFTEQENRVLQEYVQWYLEEEPHVPRASLPDYWRL